MKMMNNQTKWLGMRLFRVHSSYIFAGAALMVIGIVIGFIVPRSAEPLSANPLFDGLEQLVQFYRPFEPMSVAFLFIKNSLTASVAFLTGPILIIPAFILLFNGFIVGLISATLIDQVSLMAPILALAPHGIFELPALVIAGAAGLRLGISFIRKIKSKIRHTEYKLTESLESSFRLFLFSLVLLLVAAVMETYVTPIVIGITP